jgi:hypothetical protein
MISPSLFPIASTLKPTGDAIFPRLRRRRNLFWLVPSEQRKYRERPRVMKLQDTVPALQFPTLGG